MIKTKLRWEMMHEFYMLEPL